jgi:hypothetical protein
MLLLAALVGQILAAVVVVALGVALGRAVLEVLASSSYDQPHRLLQQQGLRR